MRLWQSSLALAVGALILTSGGAANAATKTSGSTPQRGTTIVVQKGGEGFAVACDTKIGAVFSTMPATGSIAVTGDSTATGGISVTRDITASDGISPTDIISATSGISATGGIARAFSALPSMGCGGIKVTSVSGNTISGTELDGTTAVTVTVGLSTTYTLAGQSATLADVHPGATIAVKGSPSTGTPDGTNTIEALNVTIVVPQVSGVITAVNGAALTVTAPDGASRIVTTNSSTKVDKVSAPAAVSDLTVGTAILAQGNLQSDHSLLALGISIQLPSIGGKVTAVNGANITIDSANGNTDEPAPTIVTSGQTTYVDKGTSSTGTPAIAVGSFIVATGSESIDGTKLNALRIVVIPDMPAIPAVKIQVGGTTAPTAGA